jgi:hypothetical protein
MPPRKNKRKLDEEDELDKVADSKWAALLKQDKQEEEEDKPKKEIFNFDFSKEHLLLNQKEPPKRE